MISPAKRKLLLAMGIPQWLPRQRLPGGPPGPNWEQAPAQGGDDSPAGPARPTGRPATPGVMSRRNAPPAPVRNPALKDRPREHRPPAGDELRYRAVLRPLGAEWFLLTEGDPVAVSPPARAFLQDIVHAMGLDPGTIGEAKLLDWPPPGGERLASDSAMGCEALSAFLQSSLPDGTARLICVSPRLADLVDAGSHARLVCLPELGQMMSSAAARREAWRIIGTCNERKD